MAKTVSNLRINLSAIAYCEDGVWIAHCLELDIVADGKDVDDAIQSLISLCDFQIRTAMEHADLGSVFRSAPREIWAMFAEGKGKVLEEKTRSHRAARFLAPVDRFEARQMAFA
jgi:predicted RNase H-like HicB family nuclease